LLVDLSVQQIEFLIQVLNSCRFGVMHFSSLQDDQARELVYLLGRIKEGT